MHRKLLNQEKRLEYMLRLVRIVKETGQAVLQLNPDAIFDTVKVGHHQFSTVDSEAGRKLRAATAVHLEDFPITIFEESEIHKNDQTYKTSAYPLLIGDAIEGSTNAKRGLAARIQRPIRSGTSVMVLEDERLSSVVASAFFDFASGQTFSSVRTEAGSFLAFLNEQIIPPQEVIATRGDSQIYAAVPGYSHGNVQARAQVERALRDVNIYSTGGTRSSAQDLLDIICNDIDAYVDLRTLFPGTTDRCDEVLHPWDVGGLLPVLDALGFMIADPFNRSWQDYRFYDCLAIIVARPDIGKRIQETIRDLPFVADQPDKENVIAVPFSHSI